MKAKLPVKMDPRVEAVFDGDSTLLRADEVAVQQSLSRALASTHKCQHAQAPLKLGLYASFADDNYFAINRTCTLMSKLLSVLVVDGGFNQSMPIVIGQAQ